MRLALAQSTSSWATSTGTSSGSRARSPRRATRAPTSSVLPELAVTGYPPQDLLLRPGFVRAAREAVDEVARACTDTVALVGAPAFERDLANAAFVCAGGEVAGVYRKRFLPNYGVFDEHRYFAAGRELLPPPARATSGRADDLRGRLAAGPPATELALAGADLLVNLSASPFHVGKAEDREEMLATRARDNAVYVAFCNLVGGQDELVFDGHSVVLDDEGDVIARAPGFEEALLVVDLDRPRRRRRLRDVRGGAGAHRRLRRALVARSPQLEQAAGAGLRDYVEKNGFGDVVIAAVRRHRLGADGGARGRRARARPRALASRCPRATPPRARASDARAVEREPRLRLPRDPDRGGGQRVPRRGLGRTGSPPRTSRRASAGRLLMALSNTHGWLVLATGNKSELSVGYATLYGDIVGGYALLKDVYKTDVFRLARHLNERAGRELIPSLDDRAAALGGAPRRAARRRLAAALRRGSTRCSRLRRARPLARGAARGGHDRGVVERAVALIDRAEYKRRQAPPGVKLRPKAFGRDWRTPITNRWRG